ncbi:HEPN domain-containing protein [Nioella nitratireducens]|uniref:HEPN domain-containing protein n=1 Tax=Nioella nitratireducens TaxID=1287720 RepID=UPI0011BA5266|nr:HEPN domain-containing protein [Nioella nitratireducens]
METLIEPQEKLVQRLSDIDELVSAHEALTGGGRGRPAERQGAAVTRAGIVLLCAALEAFVEETFEYYAIERFPDRLDTSQKKKDYFLKTSGSLHTLSEWNVNALYSHLGMPWILDKIRWQGFSNKQFKESFDGLCSARNKIAHGSTQGKRFAAPTLSS